MRRPLLAVGLALLAAAPVLAGADGVLASRTVPREEAQRLFEDAWRLPALRVSENERRPPLKVDLLQEMKTLAAAWFEPVPGERDLAWARSFGDIVRELRGAKGDRKRRDALLAALRDARPSVWKRCGFYLQQLVVDDTLYGDDWDAESDIDDDGILLVAPFDRARSRDPFWSKLGGAEEMHQAATLMFADLEAIKTAENDFAAYPDNVGAEYEYIHGVRNGYVRTTDADGGAMTIVRMVFENDLPFPYGTLDCDVRIRTRLDADGHLTTDLFSPSRDLYWLGGQDVSIPVRASDGTWVAMLHTRAYGFDIRNVPDGEGARHSAILGSLGNLRLRAERRFADAGGRPRTLEGAVPDFVVHGIGPAPEDED